MIIDGKSGVDEAIRGTGIEQDGDVFGVIHINFQIKRGR